MEGFWEIINLDGEVVQRLQVLGGTEREQLEARGYRVVRQVFDRSLWPWLVDPAE